MRCVGDVREVGMRGEASSIARTVAAAPSSRDGVAAACVLADSSAASARSAAIRMASALE
jgi:hypothetical protein